VPLGGFGLISLFYAFLGVRFAMQFFPNRKAIFDNRFTDGDRAMVTQAAFFFLLPVSVALHELGHAVAIWLFGGQVEDFGFYFFAGFVSYDPTGFTDAQQILVSFAGTLVNILLIMVAMGIVLFRNPPLRAPYNELLLQFSAISGLNALIVYPLLDFATGMNGDWTQMYDGNVPWLTAAIIAVQVAVIAAGVWLVRDERWRARLAARTGVRNPANRNLLGWGGSAVHRAPAPPPPELGEVEQQFRNAAARVASGWPDPVTGRLTRHPHGSALTLQWDSGGTPRVVVLQTDVSERVVLAGGATGNGHPPARTRASWPAPPSEDELTIALRLAMEAIEREAATDREA
jgi:hypothetical protein